MTATPAAGTAAAAPVDDVAGLAAALERELARLEHPARRVRDLRRLSGGASRETWSFTAVGDDDAGTPLVLRRDPPSEPDPVRMTHEATALAAAGRAGVPGPVLLGWSDGVEALGAPYLLMSHVAGETIPRRILRDERYASARAALPAQLGRAAAAVHAVPVAEVASIPRVDGVQVLRDRYDASDLPRPVLELAFAWLEEHRPPSPPADALVHGDFRLGNVIVDEQGLAAVLDWELVHRGDPMEDLGYLSIRAWRFGGPLPVAGVATFEQLFDGYAEVAGDRPDPHVVRWWQVQGTLGWAVSCLWQVHRHLAGLTRSVELAAVGRRVVEQEHELLLMTAS